MTAGGSIGAWDRIAGSGRIGRVYEATLWPMRTFDHVVITGLMASGKSTTGRRLAERLGWPWRDSDVEIQAGTGKTVRELRDLEGVEAMHEREHAELIRALDDPNPNVISAAASVIDDEASREAMTRPGVVSIWLHGSPELLAQRFHSPDDHRPTYGDSPAEFLAAQSALREPFVRAIGAHMINVDGLTREEVLDRAIRALDP
jgi:shikimate kinase